MIDVDLIKKLVDIVSYSNIEELRVGDRDIKITIKKFSSGKVYRAQDISKEAETPQESPRSEEKGEEVVYITSPIVGTFYRAPNPDAPPFIDINDEVKIGQTVCIIEAMKLMNEVKSDYNGIIRKILVENGEPVEYGQPLFLLEPTGENA
ncbi:TPA: acetyl-CoA carboxylase biotin carboxyl carrier protein [bacterium]|jgi:acetyl-CoA carboxylase biotin carboxyl carrier protein|nr:acetyl-CoA carboxylase biotin carboxyl carrier protein [bacterium]